MVSVLSALILRFASNKTVKAVNAAANLKSAQELERLKKKNK